jgi:iron(III) transport system permease protein
LTALVLLAVGVGLPLAWPFLDLLVREERLFLLAANTLCLVAGTLLLSLPLGVTAAILLYRTDLPLSGVFRYLTVLSLFVPLALITTAWQAALGAGPGSLAAWWRSESGRPWAEGLGPAIWIHAQAAMPWVIVIVGHGLRWVEADLEEDALLAAGAWTVLWRVTLPRCRGSILAAAAWVALQVSTELTVADLMLVRTFAEEVYAQLWRGGPEGLARAVAVALPLVLLGGGAVAWGLLRLERVVPPLLSLHAPVRLFALGSARWPALVLTALVLGLLAGVPLASLLIKAGMTTKVKEWSAPPGSRRTGRQPAGAPVEQPEMYWSAQTVWGRLSDEKVRGDNWLVAKSLLTAGLTGACVTTLALVLCWLAVDAPRFRRLLFIVLALTWSVPGPIIGIGLKEVIVSLVVWLPWEPLSAVLYNGPSSPVPVIWAHTLRFLPGAVAILWPVVHALPGELRDSLRVEGARPWQELRHLVVPLAFRAWCAVVVVITAQSVCEIGAVAAGVETPDWRMFAHELFRRMHYGLASDVSGLCLQLLVWLAAVAAAGALLRWGWLHLTAVRPARPARR